MDSKMKRIEETLTLVAREAGASLRQYYSKSLVIEEKAALSPVVTEADYETENLIRCILLERHPEDGIEGEEMPAHNPDSERQWVIDPIDGTISFISGFPTFAILVGYVVKGKPQAGLVLQPVTEECWLTDEKNQTKLNGVRVSVSDCKTLREARFATTSLAFVKSERQQKLLEVSAAARTSVFAGDGYAFAKLAEGCLDLVIDYSLNWYDLAALIPVVKGAGGVILDCSGQEPTAGKTSYNIVAAATLPLAEEALQKLAD